MKQRAKKLLKHPLIQGSAIVVFGSLFANLFNFLFNIYMLRNLSAADYGILATVIAIIGYPAVISTAIGPLIIRFAGEYFAKNQIAMVRGLYIKILKYLLLLGSIVFLIFLLSLPQLSMFFHIEDITILLVTNIIILLTFIGVINYPFIQAKLAFTYQVLAGFISALTKLLIGVVLVLGGLAAKGAVISLFFATLFSYVVSFIPLKFIFDKNITSPHINSKSLVKYGIPSAITLLSLNSLVATDIILVKHFFEPHQAGLYAGVSLVGRVIFFLLNPIATVMFPVIVQKHAKNENYTNTFKLSLALVFLPSVFMTLFYTLFPEFTLSFFTGGKEEYLALSPLIGYFGFFITLYTVLTIVINFYLSINKTKIVFPVTLGAILQGVLIYLYHDSFMQIILISSGIAFLLVVGLLLYYPHATKK